MNKYKPWELHIWNLHKYLKIFKNANALVVKNLRSLGPSVSHLSIFFLIFLWVNMSISYNSILICRFFWGVCWVFLAAWDFISCSALASLVVACELSCPLACRILRAWWRIESVSPCIGRWILNHWTTREVPEVFIKVIITTTSFTHSYNMLWVT